MSKRLYVQSKNCRLPGKCNHDVDENSDFFLDTEFSKKYNHCMFCAIEAWGGSMPHDEIALCLGTNRMNVCQVEKKVLEKIKKRINETSKRRMSSLRLIDSCIITVSGLSSKAESDAVKEIAFKIGCDFDILFPIELKFSTKELKLNSKVGKALYELTKKSHTITFNSREIKNKKDFIETLTHEMFHAVQVENKKNLSDSICEAVKDELSFKYYRRYLTICKKMEKAKMIGVKSHG